MINDRLHSLMMRTRFDAVRELFIARAREETARIDEAREWLHSQGYEDVSWADESTIINAGDAEYLQDGRVLIRAQKKLWALSREAWDAKRAEAMEQARQRDAALAGQQQQANPPTVCTALIDGQLCGGTLVRAAVCPRCALGKSGVAATLTCDVCGHVTAIMRGDS